MTPPTPVGAGVPPRKPVTKRLVICVDSSVVLAHLLTEDRSPPASFWQADLISGRLLEYEVWTRLHARKLAPSLGNQTRELIGRASIEFLRARGQTVELATYDPRMLAAAKTLAIKPAALSA